MLFSHRDCLGNRFEVVLSFMPATDPPPANSKPKPRRTSTKGNWTRAEKIAALAFVVAAIAGGGTWWNSYTNRANYSDNHANFEQAHLNEHHCCPVTAPASPSNHRFI